MLVYLGVCAVAAFFLALLALLGAVAPAPSLHIATGGLAVFVDTLTPAVAFHIAFATGAMPLIFGAIIHFVPVLTRGGQPPRLIRVLPLPVQLAGGLTPLGLAGWLPAWSLSVAALIVSLAALLLLAWTTRRLRLTFGAPHPGARWYGAALLCLFLAVSLVPAWLLWPDLRAPLRLFHLHMNTLGFIGLAALGTLPVLLPTTLGRPDPTAAERLRRDLGWALGGVVFIAAGATGTVWLALAGAAALLVVVARNGLAWRRSLGRALFDAGATAALLVANLGLALGLIHGSAHALGIVPARLALAVYATLFLWPLVTGALTALLPVWRYPGVAGAARARMANRLARGGRARALLFLSGGVLMAFDVVAGGGLVAAGLAEFALALGRAWWLDRPEVSDDNPRIPS